MAETVRASLAARVWKKAVDSILGPFDRDFAQKVRWRKTHERNPLFVVVQDKYKVKQYAAARGVRTAPLLHVTDKPETIPFDSLSGSYFIKANHGWGWNIFGQEGALYLHGDGSGVIREKGRLDEEVKEPFRLTREACIALCREWLARRYTRREWAYQQIDPCIIIERALTPRAGGELVDYRFYTFNGVVKAINLGSPTYRRKKLNVFFYPDWSEIKLTVYKEAVPHPLPARPDNLDEMIQIAQKLGKDFDFVRVDLYDTTDGVMLGEMTLYPEAGARHTPTACREFNRWLGAQWVEWR